MSGRFEWERALRESADVTDTGLLVLLALGTYMDADGAGARPSQTTLARVTGQSDRTIRRHLAAAVDAGWLVVVTKGRHNVGASAYKAAIPQPDTAGRLSDATGGHPRPPERTDSRTPEGPQADTGDRTAGHPCPPTTPDHVSTTTTGAGDCSRCLQESLAELDRERDPAVRNRMAVARSRAALRHADHQRRDDARLAGARSLGRSRAGNATEADLLAEVGPDPEQRAAALDAYRQATTETREGAA